MTEPAGNSKPKPDTAPGTHEAVLRLLEAEPRSKVLDMAAGEGALSLAFRERGFEVYACDIAPTFKVPDIPWKQWDLNSDASPYPEGYFDYVACVEIIEHLENPYHLVRQVRRILKGGGKLVLTTPNVTRLQSRIRFLLSGRLDNFPPDMREHINPLFFWELEHILSECGFAVECVTTNRVNKLAKLVRPLTWLLRAEDRLNLEAECYIIKSRKE
ncbi:MAG: class I SAM-dependent methyltransferase [Chloroflexota bacterium]